MHTPETNRAAIELLLSWAAEWNDGCTCGDCNPCRTRALLERIKTPTISPTDQRAKHTPGPWFADTGSDGSIGIQPQIGFMVASVAMTPPHRAQANAALIAAAPDMLEALNWALTRFADHAQYCDEDAACIEAVRAAIEKAEGR